MTPLQHSQNVSDEASLAAARAERGRAAAVNVVLAIYRLAKASMLHASNNDVIAQLIRATQSSVTECCELLNASSASVLFTGDTVFVNGQMLRATRQAYEACTELAGILEAGGVAEVTLPSRVTSEDLAALAHALAESIRKQLGPGGLKDARCGAIVLRAMEASSGEQATEQSSGDPALRTYTAAVVVVRELHGQIKAGKLHLPQRVKRVAQRLISYAEDDKHGLMAFLGTQAVGADLATTAVNCAILTSAMGLHAQADRPTVTALAMAALLHDVGDLRLQAGAKPGTREPGRTAASSVVALTALGPMQPASVMRTVMTYEAQLFSRAGGTDDAGQPAFASRCLAAARAFLEALSPAAGRPGVSFDEAVRRLEKGAHGATGGVALKLLIGALGFFVPGSAVELDTGEVAVVTALPASFGHAAQPPVSIVCGANLAPLQTARGVDLAALATRGEKMRSIRSSVDVNEPRLQGARVSLLAKMTEVLRERAPVNVPPAVATAALPNDVALDQHGKVTAPMPHGSKQDRPQPQAPASQPPAARTRTGPGVVASPEARTRTGPGTATATAVTAPMPRPKRIDDLLAAYLEEEAAEQAGSAQKPK